MEFRNIPKALVKKLLELSGDELQIQCGDIFRKLMIKQLMENKTPFAQYLNEEGSQRLVAGEYTDNYEKFLADQKTGCGTYQSLMLMAELFGFNAWIQISGQNIPFPVYPYSTDSSTPNIVLYNNDNAHWYYTNTEETSNLFHVLAQAMSDALKNESQPQLPIVNSQPGNNQQIQSDFELAASLEMEDETFSTEQNDRDFALALQMSMKEDSRPKSRSQNKYYEIDISGLATHRYAFFNSQNRTMAEQKDEEKFQVASVGIKASS